MSNEKGSEHWKEVLENNSEVRGRTYILMVLPFAIALIATWGVSNWIDNWRQEEVDKNRDILASVQVDTPEYFEYLLKTDAGKLLAEGEVSTDECVSFSEMAEGSCFAKVSKVKEAERCSITCDSDGDCRESCDWEEVDREILTVDKINFLGQSFPYSAIDLLEGDKLSVKGVIEGKTKVFDKYHIYDPKRTVRYSYFVVPTSYHATIHGATNSTADRFMGRLAFKDQHIEKVLKNADKTPITPTLALVGLGLLFFLAAAWTSLRILLEELDR